MGIQEVEEKEQIRSSVRDLVEFLLRSGDIDNTRRSVADADAMQEGSRIHRKIQGKMGASYKSEVALKLVWEEQQYDLTLEGRADGIIEDKDGTCIDEIKGVYQDVQYMKEPIYVHKAQAMCYAYIYAGQKQLDTIDVQLTYCNIETEIIKRFRETLDFQSLKEWFEDLMQQYRKWVVYQIEWKKKRQKSIKQIEFPFPYREGQRNLAVSVYRTILEHQQLFLQAATGIGKTISTVFPAVKAVGEDMADKIFYLTAKTITRTVAEEAFSILKKQGLQFKNITITAKEKICNCEEMDCNPIHCPYAKGHYDRINDAVFALLHEETDYTRDNLREFAKKKQVCPFEMTLDAALWMDGIICDYNYAFDPNVYLRRFFSEGNKSEYIFLIDEAHNLVERGREMYSASLYKEDFLRLKNEVKYYNRKLERLFEKCNRQMLEMKRECETYKILDGCGSFYLSLLNLRTEIKKFLEIEEEADIRKKILEFYLNLNHFMNMYEELDENYVIYTELSEEHFLCRLFCVNPAVKLGAVLSKGRGTVFFSATLLPIQYYKQLLSKMPEPYAVYAESPFNRSNRGVYIASDVSSKYTRRNQKEYEQIALYIKKVIQKKKGNYMAFFPSYAFMQQVYDCFVNIKEDIMVQIQENGMNEGEREEFLACFEEENTKGLVGFCVLGGMFSEGIDLRRDSLIGAFIVGTGLPQICYEREILKAYYEERNVFGTGFDYAYRYPGINKVLQAAGRVIRTSEDKGVIILMDDRFTYSQTKNLFPREWEQAEICNINTIEDKIECFWKESE